MRVLLLLSTFLWGVGPLLYIAALIIVPENTGEEVPGEPVEPVNNTLFWGISLTALGAVLLFWQLELFDRFFYFIDLPVATMWSLFLIGIGGTIIYMQWKVQQAAESDPAAADGKGHSVGDTLIHIHRSVKDRKIAGVCGGIAAYFKLDATLVRLAWILLTIASKGLGVLLYVACVFIFSEETSENQTV